MFWIFPEHIKRGIVTSGRVDQNQLSFTAVQHEKLALVRYQPVRLFADVCHPRLDLFAQFQIVERNLTRPEIVQDAPHGVWPVLALIRRHKRVDVLPLCDGIDRALQRHRRILQLEHPPAAGIRHKHLRPPTNDIVRKHGINRNIFQHTLRLRVNQQQRVFPSLLRPRLVWPRRHPHVPPALRRAVNRPPAHIRIRIVRHERPVIHPSTDV